MRENILNIQKKTVIPIYRQVAANIKADLDKGVLKSGQQLPPEPELAQIYGVSRITIRKVLAQLSNSGLVERRKGKGTFIRDTAKQNRQSIGIVYFADKFIETNEYDARILHGILDELKTDSPLTTIYLNQCTELGEIKNNYKGFFLFHPTKKNWKQIKDIIIENIPAVFVSSSPEKSSNIPMVTVDNYRGAYDAVKYLVATGRRKIAFMSGAIEKSSMNRRFSAYKDVLKDNKITFDPALVIHMDDSDENYGFEAMNSLFSGGTRPDAVFACTDLMAIGAMKAIKEKGLSIPADIAIIGFDNSRMSPYTEPPLSTVDADIEQLGCEAAKILLSLISGNTTPRDIEIASKLVIRKSC